MSCDEKRPLLTIIAGSMRARTPRLVILPAIVLAILLVACSGGSPTDELSTVNDPTTGSGIVTYTFTIHNFGATPVTLGGTLAVSGTASVSCTGGNTLTLSGSLAANADVQFSRTCTYMGTSGQNVSATINATFTDPNGLTGTVSGSPSTYIFTVQRS